MSNPISNQWFCLKEGQTYGPYDTQQMKQFIMEGTVSKKDLIWCQGMEQWLPAGQVSSFMQVHRQADKSGHTSSRSPQAHTNKSKNSKKVSGFGLIGLILAFLILIVTGWFSQASIGIERTIFNADYYTKLSRDIELSSFLHRSLEEQMRPRPAGPGVDPQGPTGAEIQSSLLMMEIFHEAWVEEQFLMIVEDLIAVLDGEQNTFTASIQLGQVKEQLSSSTDPDLQQLGSELPENIPLQSIFGADPDSWHQFQRVVSNLQTFRSLFNIGPYIVFIMLIAFCIFVAGFNSSLKWVGSSAIISGITFLGLLQIGNFTMVNIFPPETLQEAEAFTGHIISSMSTVSLIFAGIGLLSIIAGFALNKMQHQ